MVEEQQTQARTENDETQLSQVYKEDMIKDRNPAGSYGMWIFLITEVLFFTVVLIALISYRVMCPEAFSGTSSFLGNRIGVISTFVLIGSGVTMFAARRSARGRNRKDLIRFLLLTIILGSLFILLRGFDCYHKYSENLIPWTSFVNPDCAAQESSLFFSVFFGIMGFHLLYLIIGLGILVRHIVLTLRNRKPPEYIKGIGLAGIYWYLQLVIWIFMYAILYLAGR